MKKLNKPIYSPILCERKDPDSNAYGVARMLAHAMPMAIMGKNRNCSFWMKYNEIKLKPQISRTELWVPLRPIFR